MATGFGDMQSLLKQAQEMQRRMQDAQRSLGERILEGSSGGGAVKAYVNGNQELQAVKELRDREMGKVTGGMNLPGMGF